MRNVFKVFPATGTAKGPGGGGCPQPSCEELTARVALLEEERRILVRERDEAREELYRGTVRHDDPTQRELSHLAGVVGALRERNRHLFELLRLVDSETRQPSERFDEVWAEVREVLRG